MRTWFIKLKLKLLTKKYNRTVEKYYDPNGSTHENEIVWIELKIDTLQRKLKGGI